MNEENDEHELEKIKLRKMKEIMEAQKRQQASQERESTIYDKIEYILKVVLAPDAYAYFNRIKSNEPQVYQRIYNELISPEVFQSADYLLGLIARQGGVPRQIPLDVIIYLERQVKGVKGKIQVKHGDGDMMDLGSYLTKE